MSIITRFGVEKLKVSLRVKGIISERKAWRRLSKTKLFKYVPDKIAVAIKYKNHFYKKLNMKDPKTFNEKLQWLKIYDRRPEYTMLADKLHVKDYVTEKVGAEYVIPTLGVWDSFDEIDFSSLPNQFVLKCTHGSGDTIICKNKPAFNIVNAKEVLETSLNTDYYLISREWPYKDVPRKIICEKYLEDKETGEARDYKFFCFYGKVKCFKVDFGRFTQHHANWYYPDGQIIEYGEQICPPDFGADICLPSQINSMIRIAEVLSEKIPFIRVDFYCINGQIFVGELTFYPASGLLRFTDDEWDKRMGVWLTLPKKNV